MFWQAGSGRGWEFLSLPGQNLASTLRQLITLVQDCQCFVVWCLLFECHECHEFFVLSFFKYSMTLSPLHIKPCWKDFSGYRLDRLVSSLPSLSWWLAVHNDNKINSIQAWNQKEKKEVMYPSCYTGIKGNFCMLYDVFLWLCRDKFFFDDLDFSSKFNQIFTPFY